MTVTKYSANGNDFVMFLAQEKSDRSQLARELCHRQNGVGADGLVVLLPHTKYDFEWEALRDLGKIGPGLLVEVVSEDDQVLVWLK